MTREDVLKLFPEATDEQITNLLNQNNSEVAREKNKANQYKADADKAKGLQDELDRINEKGLSEVEKTNKLLEKANNRIAELEKAAAISVQKSTVVDKFKVTSEQANRIVKEDGSLYIIDWSHATQGNASADCAMTYVLFMLEGKNDLAEKYLNIFSEKAQIEKSLIQRWIPIVSAIKLEKANEQEQEMLKQWITVMDYQ